MAAVWAVVMGVGLAAACGLRVFLPMFVAGGAARLGFVELGGQQWLASDQALILLGVATVAEIGAYYVPWLDNLLDAVSTPAAVVAGTLLSAAFIVEVNPLLKWTFAAIAGGGLAGAVQLSTVTLRATSSATTGGLLNPIVSTLEGVGALVFSVLALAGFALIGIGLAAFPLVALTVIWRARRKRAAA